jgi:hypothetical protein
MKIYILLMFFACGYAVCSTAQLPLGYSIRTNIDLYNSNLSASGNLHKILTEEDIEGSPYLNDEFVEGSIYTVQKIQYAQVPLRYNIYNDNLEFKTPANVVQALADPGIVERAVFGETHMINSPYMQANKTKKSFFIILEEGKVSLYAKPEVVYKPPTEAAAYKEPEPPKFIKKEDGYYLRVGTDEAQPIANKKNLVAAFPDNQDKIESYISKNKIKTNNPENLIDLVKFYNSL